MYFGTNYGACVYDGSIIKPLDLPGVGNERQVHPISALKEKKLFINFSGNTNLFKIDKGLVEASQLAGEAVIERVYDQFSPYPLLCTNQGLFKSEKNILQKIPLGLQNNDRMVAHLLPLSKKRLFVARKGYTPAIISGEDFRKISESTTPLHINDVIEDFNGNIWLATETFGLMLLDAEALEQNEIKFKPVPARLQFLADKKEAVLSFTLSKKDSSLLIGTADHGLIIVAKKGEVNIIDYTTGLSSNRVNCVYTGSDDVIWIGTNRGIDKISNTDIVIYGRTIYSNSDNIYTTNIDCHNRLWFFKNDFLYYFEDNIVKKIPYPAGVEKIPLSCANVKNGFWLSLPKSLVFIDCKAQTPVVKKVFHTSEIYRRMIEWQNDEIILGSDNHIAIMKNNRPKVINDSLKMTRSLFKDKYGSLWIGTFDNGLYRFAIHQKDENVTAEQLYRYYDFNKTYNRYLAITEDQSGNILAANKFHGIYVFSNSDRRSALISRLNKTNGLTNDDISTFYSGGGAIWYGTTTSINRLLFINGKAISKDLSPVFGIYNNVAKISKSNNNLCVATDAGLYIIKQKTERNYDVPVYFKEIAFPDGGLRLNSRDTSIKLKSSQNTFTVNFTAPFFVNEYLTRYKYRLVSQHSRGEWNLITGNRSINFNSLSHGSYILQINASAYNDLPNNIIASLKFQIDKPFYQQAWFIVATTLITFLLLFSIYSWRIAQVKKVLSVRNNISKDLHDEIGATLSSINIYTEIAREKSNGNKEVNSLLARIYSGSQQALESINDIVWYVDPRNDNFENIIAKMQDFAIPVLEAKNIEPAFETHDAVLSCNMTMQVRQNTYRIFKEAINNILKYSHAKKVLVKIAKSGNFVTLKIEDDGVGFNPATVIKGNGLNNMITRASAMNGIFNIDATAGRGCKIELFCPIT